MFAVTEVTVSPKLQSGHVLLSDTQLGPFMSLMPG